MAVSAPITTCLKPTRASDRHRMCVFVWVCACRQVAVQWLAPLSIRNDFCIHTNEGCHKAETRARDTGTTLLACCRQHTPYFLPKQHKSHVCLQHTDHTNLRHCHSLSRRSRCRLTILSCDLATCPSDSEDAPAR